MKIPVLITGVAGFIGFHLAQYLFKTQEYDVIGLDNLNDYYDVQLKHDRLAILKNDPHFTFHQLCLSDRPGLAELFSQNKFKYVVNLAAQAGVRYSIENPHAYADSNLTGFVNLLEGCRHSGINHLVFASSSSVYGANQKIPFATTDDVNQPISLYAATKKANELMAYAYSHLYQIPATGLRFFTVYGAWGRPDMAYFKFVKAIQSNQPIDVYNFGNMQRDFTYIDDVVEGIYQVMLRPPAWQNSAPYKLYNLGHNQPVKLSYFIEVIEKALNKQAIKNYLPMQPGDVPITYADIDDLINEIGFRPQTSIEDGISKFVAWYQNYYSNPPSSIS